MQPFKYDPKVNSGDLRHKIDILKLDASGNVYNWGLKNSVWAKVESTNKLNIFSKVGIGVKTIKFTMYKCDLGLHNAIRWEGQHCFLTDIAEIDQRYYEVTAAQIEPKKCVVIRNTPDKNDLNRPVLIPEMFVTFPGCLVEKYLGFEQKQPPAVNELTYVLVTPKAISLQTADLVKIEDITFNVRVAHTLDEFKNEYEITAIKEA